MDTPVLADWQGLIFICSFWTLDAILMTYQGQIGLDGKRESKESKLLVCLNDDDDDDDDG